MDVVHTAIWVSDLAASEAFYGDALGLEYSRGFTADDGVENHYYAGGNEIAIQLKYDPDGERNPSPAGIDHIALKVDTLDDDFDRITDETECPVVKQPFTLELDSRSLRVAFIEDPDGYVIELVEAR